MGGGMYLEFYGLAEKPFAPTPDPRFLQLTNGHREALSQLVYTVEERMGFSVLIGEVGTGKTTLLRALLARLDPGTSVAYVFNSTLGFEGILEYALADYGIQVSGATPAQRILALNTFLIERQAAGQNTVLVIDEAQNLDVRTLEEIRLLSNFESPTAKLLQIVLAGQPELDAKLERPELRQLRQRIGLHCEIRPLSADEVGQYIAARLEIAGASRVIFTPSAIRRIAQTSRGVPRLVNILCDHALIAGYALQRRTIDRDVADEAIDYLRAGRSRVARRALHSARRRRSTPVAWAAGAAAAVVLVGAALVSETAPRLVTSAATHASTLAASALSLFGK